MVQNAQLDTAIMHISRMAEGQNPLSEEMMEKESVLNSPEIIRTMFVVKGILEEVKEKGYRRLQRVNDDRPVEFPKEIHEKFKPKRVTTVTHFIHDCYMYADNKEAKEVAPKTILEWLTVAGFLDSYHDTEFNVDYKRVTKKGDEIGLSNRRVQNGLGGRSYISVMFSEAAQYFVVENMEKIINGEAYEVFKVKEESEPLTKEEESVAES